MALMLDKVHDFHRVPGTLEVRLSKVTPYVRITSGGQPPIFVQEGVCYSEGGQIIDPPPPWFQEEVLKLSETVRAEVGLPPLEPPAPAAETPQPKPRPKPPKRPVEQWTCPAEGCGKTMSLRAKTFHELHHKKQAARAQQETAEP